MISLINEIKKLFKNPKKPKTKVMIDIEDKIIRNFLIPKNIKEIKNKHRKAFLDSVRNIK